jgi:hypothetical protein
MKKISLVSLALVLTLTFTASDIVVEKGNKPESAHKCPYLERLEQSQSGIQCPHLNGAEEGRSSCPYMEENSQSHSGCPYIDGGSSGECPYLKENGGEVLHEIEYHPLPEVKNT